MIPRATLSTIFLCILSVSAAGSPRSPTQLFSPLIPQKVLATFNALPDPMQYPQYTDMYAGKWKYFAARTWTSGFFPATLYALNTRKNLCGVTSANGLGMADWLNMARSVSSGLIPLADDSSEDHDVGFLSYPFVEELMINPNNHTATETVNKFATFLANRFDPIVGCTRSWNKGDPTDFQVIIDNMMNLEVLLHSYALTGNLTLRDIAIVHADTTINNHIRRDGSTWHLVEYNSTTGAVIKKGTVQGFADDSTWARGQAWGIYAYANMFRFIGDERYLNTSRLLATYFLDNLPTDGIVPWDFNAPLAPALRPADSSAAAIAANGLLLLARHEHCRKAAKRWSDAAIQVLDSITTLAWRPSWQSLLSNGTINKPASNFLTGIVYGDYYYIKAGTELVKMGLATC